eukprot:645202_1
MTNHMININKWGKQKQSPIGKNILLRFGSQGCSLGISYWQNDKRFREFGLNADDLLYKIGKYSPFMIKDALLKHLSTHLAWNTFNRISSFGTMLPMIQTGKIL